MRTIFLATMLLVSPGLARAAMIGHAFSPYSVASPVFTCGTGDQSLAINGLLANGGTVTIGAGTCSLSHGLVLSVPGTVLNGAGMGQTILQANGPLKFDVVTFGLPKINFRADSMTISNLTTDSALHGNANGASKIGRGVVVNGNVTQSAITNVETRYGLDGVTIAGSQITVTGLWTHDNRHAGIYVAGNANMPAPYNFADSDTLTRSRADNNVLDNTSTRTWDNINFDKLSSRGTITGNEATGGDILISCSSTSNSGCSGAIGPFLIQGNTVTDANPFGMAGIRLYGTVVGAVVTGNTLSVPVGSGIIVAGPVTASSVDHNTITGTIAYGVHVFPISGSAPGAIAVSANGVQMGNRNKPAFAIEAATNVTLTGNNGNGAAYDTSRAGAGLVMSGNR